MVSTPSCISKAGDITNLIGCLLTQQVQTQLFTAIYFCVIDSMMVGQHMYYNPPWKKEKAGGGSKSVNAMLLPIICVAAMPLFVSAAYGGGGFGEMADSTATVVATGGGRGGFGTVGGMDVGVGAGAGYSAPAAAPLHHHSSSGGRVLLSYDDGAMPSRSSLSSTNIGGGGDPGGTEWYGPHTDPKWSWATKNGMIGYVCGWVSGILYFTSRIPQIRLNFKRKTCDGLNPVMFIMVSVQYSPPSPLPPPTCPRGHAVPQSSPPPPYPLSLPSRPFGSACPVFGGAATSVG